jgi:hypothetical protein
MDVMARQELEELAATHQELTVLDGLIRDYIGKELDKIDATAHVILELKARALIHREEADRLYMIAKNEAQTEARIKELVLAVMEQFGEKKLRGNARTLSAVGNGGVQALTIGQPDLVPLALRRVKVELSGTDDARVVGLLMERGIPFLLGESEAHAGLIRQRLEAGEGVAGCRLEPLGTHLRVK